MVIKVSDFELKRLVLKAVPQNKDDTEDQHGGTTCPHFSMQTYAVYWPERGQYVLDSTWRLAVTGQGYIISRV